jgi:hypothetical protein
MSSSEKEWYLHVISAKQIHALQTHVRQVIVGALLGDGCIIAPKKAEVGPRTCCSLRMQLQRALGLKACCSLRMQLQGANPVSGKVDQFRIVIPAKFLSRVQELSKPYFTPLMLYKIGL